jgi:ParB family chromosome partitioning protein
LARRKTTKKVVKRRKTSKRFKSGISYRLKEIPIKQIKVWKEAQARVLDREGIAELAKSIKNEGLQNPPMLQKESKNTYLLMSGQRRLAALKRLRAKKIPALVLTKQSAHELEDAKAVSVVENIHRNKMSVRDTATACKFLAEKMGKSKAAQSLGLSTITFRKYLGFAGVPEQLKKLVPKEISRDEAVKLYQAVPSISKALKIIQKISKLDSRSRRLYLTALARSPKSSHKTLLKRAKAMRVRQNISFKLTKSQARKLASKANRADMNSAELANQVIAKWLKR